MTKLAFQNVEGPVFRVTEEDLNRGLEASRNSSRKRFILPIHREQQALVQRMINFMQPGTYVRPHRHPRAGACESIAVLRGSIRFRIFSDTGEVLQQFDLSGQTPEAVVDIEPNVWHSFDVLEPDTILFETKMGPYDANLDKEFAPWSEEEHY